MYEFDVYGTALEHRADPKHNNHSLPALRELFGRAESHGFAGMLLDYNHQHIDPWVNASTLLGATRTMVPLVAVNPYAIPPFSAARMIHSLSSQYGRRVDLNMITGARPRELEQIGDTIGHDERYDRATEYVRTLRAMLGSDRALTYEGRYYRFSELDMHAKVDAELTPRFFVAGASEASRRMATAVADYAITHPQPVDMYAKEFVAPREGGVQVGIRVALLARPTSEQAWQEARERYPDNRLTRLMVTMRGKSDSEWSRRIAELAKDGEVYDGVYWTGIYRADKGAAPLLVGSYEQVAEYLGRYLDLGITKVLLGYMFDEEDFRHADAVLSMLRAGQRPQLLAS